MNPNVFALSRGHDGRARRSPTLQGARDVEMVFYLYVVDERRHLVGVVSLRRLLLVSPETPLKRIMTTDLISVRVDTDQEEVARQVASYNLLAIPVVDEENKLVGVITVDDVIDVIKDEATEDIYRLAGVSGDERVFTPTAGVAAEAASRGCWSISATAFLAAGVVGAVRGTRSRRGVALADRSCRSSPGMGGNAATQTLTVIVRGLALGELTWSNARQGAVQGNPGRHRQRRRDRASVAGLVVVAAAGATRCIGLLLCAGDGHQPVRGRRRPAR